MITYAATLLRRIAECLLFESQLMPADAMMPHIRRLLTRCYLPMI